MAVLCRCGTARGLPPPRNPALARPDVAGFGTCTSDGLARASGMAARRVTSLRTVLRAFRQGVDECA